MNKHTVFVAGKRFILLSDDKEEYVKKLAEDVSAAISNIIAENPSLDRRSAALLCALDYADDKEKEKLRNKSLSDKAQVLSNNRVFFVSVLSKNDTFFISVLSKCVIFARENIHLNR